MPPSYYPLRWESTGDQWWYASPIDWAAANGHYDLVRELLHIDPNLLIKLTSLRRIRRLETVWDDDPRFLDSARRRASVARSLLLECESNPRAGGNSLIRAGYGGWLVYTAASAGDEEFVMELLRRDPLMVFGEGEFGVSDVLYAAARSGNSKVFRVLLEFAMSPRCAGKGPAVGGGERFGWEIRNRAVHAAARGGSLEMVKELLVGCEDVLEYRDALGCSVLHAAAGRGQVEVVKGLLAAFDIVEAKDNQGNTSLHVAAFRGHLAVVEVLISACPASTASTNYTGDTFLHLAVYGFRTSGFRRLDRQMELVRQITSGNTVNVGSIVNMRNSDGRTILHLAVIGKVHYNLVSLLMKIPSMDLNARDVDGMTPLDLLNQRPQSATSELLVRQMLSAGGVPNPRGFGTRSSLGSYPRLHGIVSSPGTCFKISDAEILLYTGIEAAETSGDRGSGILSSCSTDSHSGLTVSDASDANRNSTESKRRSSTASRLKSLFHWPRQMKKKKKKKDTGTSKSGDESTDSSKKWTEREDPPTPLRQRFSKPTSLQSNKRALAVRSSSTSPSSKKKFAAGLRRGVIEAMPHLAPEAKTASTSPSRSSMASPISRKGARYEIENEGPSSNSSVIVESSSLRSSFVNSKLMNQYFCFGAHGLNVEDPKTGRRSRRFFKRSVPSAA